jgi:DNA-binding MarR family transcriptional regulator
MSTDIALEPLVSRIADGLDRIARVARAELWGKASGVGINPVQAQVLTLVARRGAARARDIAADLGVTPASLADTLAAMEKKALIARAPDPKDARAALVSLTSTGEVLARELSSSDTSVTRAVAALPADRQEALLTTQIALIRQLQEAGAIPLQRLCVTCRHFTTNAHPGARHPHHCAFIGAAIGGADLRLDCRDHESAPPALQSANWSAFTTGSPSLQA